MTYISAYQRQLNKMKITRENVASIVNQRDKKSLNKTLTIQMYHYTNIILEHNNMPKIKGNCFCSTSEREEMMSIFLNLFDDKNITIPYND